MLQGMSWEQFLEWQSYDRIEPIGDHRSDWQTASICSTLANIAASKGKSKKRFQPKDFLLEFTDEPKEKGAKEDNAQGGQSWQDMKWYARMFAAAANAPSKRKWKR